MIAAGLPVNDIIFDMPIGRYNLITAPHPSVPFSSAYALEVAPADPRLAMRLKYSD